MHICSSCNEPSNEDPCETCVEIEKILAMSDEEILASSTPEQRAWAEGLAAGLRIALKVNNA